MSATFASGGSASAAMTQVPVRVVEVRAVLAGGEDEERSEEEDAHGSGASNAAVRGSLA